MQPDRTRPAPDYRLESWGEIAAYLNRSITTVQRWERQEGLPVRRLEHVRKPSVFALRSELDAWLAGRVRRRARGWRWLRAVRSVWLAVADGLSLGWRRGQPAAGRAVWLVLMAIAAEGVLG